MYGTRWMTPKRKYFSISKSKNNITHEQINSIFGNHFLNMKTNLLNNNQHKKNY